MRERTELLKKIQEVGFSLLDTNLYLDAYPSSREAMAYYEELSEKYDGLVDLYEEKFGPLTPKSTSERGWNWINSPWPWETEA